MILSFDATEIFRLEDTLRGVELPTGDARQPYTLSPTEWQDAMLKVGAALGDGGYLGLTEHECWALIRLLSVYDPVGLTIKVKLYAALNESALSFLTELPNAEEHDYASESASASTPEGRAEDDASTRAPL